jgi:ribosomal protein S18 acetylase RimI-like enzyme
MMRLRRLNLHERRAVYSRAVAEYTRALSGAELFPTAAEARMAAVAEIARWLDAPALELHAIVEAAGAREVGQLWLELPASGAAFLAYLSVEPAERRAGRGRAALALAEELARARGYRSMSLSVLSSNQPALRLYLSAGYQIVRVSDGRRCRLAKLLGASGSRAA